MNNPAPDDIQREMEQRALRNVRGLVDKMEDLEAHDARAQRRYLVGIVVGAVIVLVMLAGGLWLSSKRSQSEGVVIDTSKVNTQQQQPR